MDADGGGKVTQTVMAHSQGLAALAAAGSLFATSGWGSRAGQPVPDPFIKVTDPLPAWVSLLVRGAAPSQLCHALVAARHPAAACL